MIPAPLALLFILVAHVGGVIIGLHYARRVLYPSIESRGGVLRGSPEPTSPPSRAPQPPCLPRALRAPIQ